MWSYWSFPCSLFMVEPCRVFACTRTICSIKPVRQKRLSVDARKTRDGAHQQKRKKKKSVYSRDSHHYLQCTDITRYLVAWRDQDLNLWRPDGASDQSEPHNQNSFDFHFRNLDESERGPVARAVKLRPVSTDKQGLRRETYLWRVFAMLRDRKRNGLWLVLVHPVIMLKIEKWHSTNASPPTITAY